MSMSISGTISNGEIARLKALLEDETRRAQLLQTTGKELDLLQALSELPGIPVHSRAFIFKLMLHLSKRSGLCPQCLTIRNVKKLGDHPVDWGGFGDVWKGKIGDQVVCLKVVKVYLASDTDHLVKAYMREAIVWQQLKHPNLLPFLGMYYLGETREQLCLVSPWMERGNLIRYLKEKPRHLVKHHSLARDVASSLTHLHEMKIVHGDLKGINVLVTPDEIACIGDFGLARVADSRAVGFSSTTSGSSKGTIRWQAPELLSSDPPNVVSTKSDIYAFACVCYEIFTSRVPFYELMDGAVVVALLLDKKRPSRPIAPNLPEIQDSIWEMMMSCWNTDPQLRPTAKDVLARLESEVTERNEPVRDWTDSVDLGKLRDHVKYPSVDVEAVTEMLKSLGTEERQQELDNHKPDSSSEFSIGSFYEECEHLKSRLLLLPGFDRYLSFIKSDSTKDTTTQLFDLFSLGTPLCLIFDLLPHGVVPRRIGRLRVGSDDHSVQARKEAISLFINGLEDIVEQVPGVEMLTLDDLWTRNSFNGLRKVTKTVEALLDYRDQDAIRMRNLCAQELVLTDRKFVQDMEILQQYASAVINANILEKDDALYLLLSNVGQLLTFQKWILQRFEDYFQRPWEEQRWGEPFLQREYDFLIYASYSNYYQAATNSVIDNESKLSAFNNIIHAKSEVPAFIIKPISRVCKYPLLLDSLVRYSSSHPHLNELHAAAEASKRTSDRLNQIMRESETLTTSQALRSRVEDWKGIPVDQIGKLIRDDAFILNVKNVDREYYAFLFERVLLCCKDAVPPTVRRNGGLGKSLLWRGYDNSRDGGKLVIKGRVYLQDVKQVALLPAHSESPESRKHYPLAILWKAGNDDNNDSVECVKLSCRSEEQAREWEKSLDAAITAVRLRGVTKMSAVVDGFNNNKNVDSSLVKVKVYLPSGQSIRLRFPEDSTRQELVDGIFKKVHGLDERFVDSESLRVQYEDEDGVYVSLTTDEDVQKAFADGAAVLRIQWTV